MIIEHLTKEELQDKVLAATGIFKHEGTYNLDINWDANIGTINLIIKVETNKED